MQLQCPRPVPRPTVMRLDVPEPAAGEVRVRVRAASVNGFDLAVAGGMQAGVMEHRFPVVLGKDFAGTVDAVGEGVDRYALGDRVFGVVTKPYLGDGSFGEYVTVPASVGIAHLPEQIDFVQGAAIGLAGVAAAMAVDAAQLRPGHTVLIAGATGGVGNQAVQYAARAGATVLATARAGAEQTLVSKLGAGEVFDYTGDLSSALRARYPDGVDAVLHLAGDPVPLLALVRPGGRLVSTLVMTADQLPADDVTVVPVYTNPDAATLDRCAQHALSGGRTVVQATFPLEQTAQALELFAGGTLERSSSPCRERSSFAARHDAPFVGPAHPTVVRPP